MSILAYFLFSLCWIDLSLAYCGGGRTSTIVGKIEWCCVGTGASRNCKGHQAPSRGMASYAKNDEALADFSDLQSPNDDNTNIGYYQFLLLNVVVSVISSLFVIAFGLSAYVCWLKYCQKHGSIQKHSFQKVAIDCEEENRMIDE
eukprot:711477_1